MKGIGSELASIMTVLSIPVGIALVFPYEGLGFRASARETSKQPAVSFVRLSSDEEARAMRAAKTSWQNSESVRNRQADIYFSELPEETFPSVMTEKERRHEAELPIVERGEVPFLPSCRAAPPLRISPDGKREDPSAFSREELLKID